MEAFIGGQCHRRKSNLEITGSATISSCVSEVQPPIPGHSAPCPANFTLSDYLREKRRILDRNNSREHLRKWRGRFHLVKEDYTPRMVKKIDFCVFLTPVVLGMSGENFKKKFEEMKIQCTPLRKRLA